MFELGSLVRDLASLDGAGIGDDVRIDQIAVLEQVKAAAAAARATGGWRRRLARPGTGSTRTPSSGVRRRPRPTGGSLCGPRRTA